MFLHPHLASVASRDDRVLRAVAFRTVLTRPNRYILKDSLAHLLSRKTGLDKTYVDGVLTELTTGDTAPLRMKNADDRADVLTVNYGKRGELARKHSADFKKVLAQVFDNVAEKAAA